MDILIGILFALLPFALIAGVVVAIVAARRGADEEPDEGIGTVRRLFLYGIAFVALIFAAVGLSMLLGGALNALAGDLVLSTSDTELAVALAFIVVGAPAWLIFALLAQRTVTRQPAERRSQLRRSYFAAVRGVALSVAIVNAINVAGWVAGVEDFDGDPWGWLVAWGAVWGLHTRLVQAEPAPTAATRLFDRLYLYFATVVGLYVFGGGVITAVVAPLSATYDALFRDTLVARSWHEELREGVALGAVGLAVWAWHWLRLLARRDGGTTLWYVYVFLAGITPGLTAAVTSLAVLLFRALEWWFGDPNATHASEHFAALPATTGVLLVGALSWGYHRAALREDARATSRWSEPERIYRYLTAAAGLLTLAAGAVTLLAVCFDALPPRADDLFRPRGWRSSSLILGITLVAVGLPLWARYWRQTQREAAEEGAPERATLPRRAYLFGFFGIAALTTLIDLTIIVFQLFEGILEGTLSSEFFRETRWSLALVLVAGAVSGYHWLVLREDQAAAPAAAAALPVRKREVIVLAPGNVDALLDALRATDGVSVRRWERPGSAPAIDAPQIAALQVALARADGDRFLLVAGDDGYELIPYRPA